MAAPSRNLTTTMVVCLAAILARMFDILNCCRQWLHEGLTTISLIACQIPELPQKFGVYVSAHIHACTSKGCLTRLHICACLSIFIHINTNIPELRPQVCCHNTHTQTPTHVHPSIRTHTHTHTFTCPSILFDHTMYAIYIHADTLTQTHTNTHTHVHRSLL